MKKTALALLLLLSLLLCSCDLSGVANMLPTEYTGEDEAPTEAPTQPTDKDPLAAIKRREVSDFAHSYFCFEGDDVGIVFSFPDDWTLSESEDGYSILRDGKAIGALSVGAPDQGWTEISSRDSVSNDINKTRIVESYGEGEDAQYRYRTVFDYNGRKLTLTCDYAELDDIADRKVSVGARLEGIGNQLCLNMLDVAKDRDILILGNSFINSSQIGYILQDMIAANGKALGVNAISRGYAEVDTYIGDPVIMDSIRNGDYACVFICGFYALEEADHLQVLEEACGVSNTELVIFPAHNEFEDCIKAAQDKCPSLKTLDWRGEINMLIESGVDQWALCVNDMHKHSTPLAGYIGAQMIYRAIYGQLPYADPTASIDMEYVRSVLGDYVSTGRIPLSFEVHYFNAD